MRFPSYHFKNGVKAKVKPMVESVPSKVAIYGDGAGFSRNEPVSVWVANGQLYIADMSEDGQYVAGGYRRTMGRDAVKEMTIDEAMKVLDSMNPKAEVWATNNGQARWLHTTGTSNVAGLKKRLEHYGIGKPSKAERDRREESGRTEMERQAFANREGWPFE